MNTGMNNTRQSIRIHHGRRLLLPLLLIAMISCSKDDIQPLLEDGKSTVIYDLAGDTNASMSDGVDGKEKRPFHTFLFRFRDKKQIWIRSASDSSQYLKSGDWDIAFTGPYNSEIYLNNAENPYNPGYQGPARNTGVVKYDKPYNEVTSAPADSEFEASDISKIGWSSGENSSGWFTYSLNSHLAIPLKNRTYVLKLPDGKYAKLELLNVYKGNPPAVTDLYWPAPYLTFRYYVQQDGSRNLDTNKQ